MQTHFTTDEMIERISFMYENCFPDKDVRKNGGCEQFKNCDECCMVVEEIINILDGIK